MVQEGSKWRILVFPSSSGSMLQYVEPLLDDTSESRQAIREGQDSSGQPARLPIRYVTENAIIIRRNDTLVSNQKR